VRADFEVHRLAVEQDEPHRSEGRTPGLRHQLDEGVPGHLAYRAASPSRCGQRLCSSTRRTAAPASSSARRTPATS